MRTSRLAALIVAATLTLTLSGCGSDDPKPDPSPTKATSSVPTVTPSTAPTTPGSTEPPKTDYCGPDQKPGTGEAAEKFGADKVLAAYCDMIEFSIQNSFTDLMRPVDGMPDAAAFGFMNDYFTPAMQNAWKANVQKALTVDDAKSWNDVYIVTLADLDALKTTYGADFDQKHAYAMNFKASPATTAVTTVGKVPALQLRFKLEADIPLVKAGKPVHSRVWKDVTYTLVPNADKAHPWLIERMTGSWKFPEPVDGPPKMAEQPKS